MAETSKAWAPETVHCAVKVLQKYGKNVTLETATEVCGRARIWPEDKGTAWWKEDRRTLADKEQRI